MIGLSATDIIIFNDDLPSHIESVRQVLQRCAEHGITLNKKFVLGVPETNYRGFKVSKPGYTPDDNLVSALRNDTRARDMPRLTIGDWVRVQDHRDKRWETVAKVVGCNKRGRSYTVEMSDGSTRWRNRRFLLKYYGPTPF